MILSDFPLKEKYVLTLLLSLYIMSSLSLCGTLEFEIEFIKINKVWTLVEAS
jgi:hypothetical protein